MAGAAPPTPGTPGELVDEHSIGAYLLSAAALEDSAALDSEIATLDARIGRLRAGLQADKASLSRSLAQSVDAAAAQHGGAAASALSPFKGDPGLLSAGQPSGSAGLFDTGSNLLAAGGDQPAAAADSAGAWFAHLRGREGPVEGPAAGASTQPLVKALSAQLLRLPPDDALARDGLLALLAPLLPQPQLWQLCVRWRDKQAEAVAATGVGVDHLPETAGILRQLSAVLERSLSWLQADLGLVRVFSSEQSGGGPGGPGGAAAPEVLLDQICLRRVFEAFHHGLKRLAREWQVVRSADPAESVVVAAVECCQALLRFERRAAGLLRPFAPELADSLSIAALGGGAGGRLSAWTHIEQHGPWLGEAAEAALEQCCREVLAVEATALGDGGAYPSVEPAALRGEVAVAETVANAQDAAECCPPRVAVSCAQWAGLASKLMLGTQNFIATGGGPAGWEWRPPPVVLVPLVVRHTAFRCPFTGFHRLSLQLCRRRRWSADSSSSVRGGIWWRRRCLARQTALGCWLPLLLQSTPASSSPPSSEPRRQRRRWRRRRRRRCLCPWWAAGERADERAGARARRRWSRRRRQSTLSGRRSGGCLIGPRRRWGRSRLASGLS